METSFKAYKHFAMAALFSVGAFSTSIARAHVDTFIEEHPGATIGGAAVAGAVVGAVVGKAAVGAANWLKDRETVQQKWNERGFRAGMHLEKEPVKSRVAIITDTATIKLTAGRLYTRFFDTHAGGTADALMVQGEPAVINPYMWATEAHVNRGFIQPIILAYPRALGVKGEQMAVNSICANLGRTFDKDEPTYIPVPNAVEYSTTDTDYSKIPEKMMFFYLQSDVSTNVRRMKNDGIIDRLAGRTAEEVWETIPLPSMQLMLWEESLQFFVIKSDLAVKTLSSLTCSTTPLK